MSSPRLSLLLWSVVGAMGIVGSDCAASIPDNVVVVDCDASTNGAGGSWSDPYNDLQDAIDFAETDSEVDQVWVKSSDCYPVTPSTSPTLTDRRVAFDLKPGVSVFGGFEGTELSLNERELDLQGAPTTLDGDIDLGAGESHSFHVVTSSDAAVTLLDTLIDGFVIRNGIADGGNLRPEDDDGAGAFFDSSDLDEEIPQFRNVWFEDNQADREGGGVYAFGLKGAFEDCRFITNTATNAGGAIAIDFLGGREEDGSSCNDIDGELRRCEFDGNEATKTTASGLGGGAVWCDFSARVYECSFWNNTTTGDGGALGAPRGDVDIVNSIFAGNVADGGSEGGGGAVYCGGTTSGACGSTDFPTTGKALRMTNCLIVGNASDDSGAAIQAPIFALDNCTIADNETSLSTGAAVYGQSRVRHRRHR